LGWDRLHRCAGGVFRGRDAPPGVTLPESTETEVRKLGDLKRPKRLEELSDEIQDDIESRLQTDEDKR
jgi:hypothetical protein